MMLALSESNQDVVTIPPAADASDAARLMHRAGVGCLVVVEGDRPVGILTDRDLCLRGVAPNRSGGGQRPVNELMTTPVECLGHDVSVDEALRHMRTLGVRRLPLIDDGGCLVGLVALDDLLALLAGSLHDLAVEALESQRQAWREARAERARDELEHLVAQVRDGTRRARWSAQERFFEEVEQLKSRARELFGLEG
jgi:CBS domain-containing protein